MHCKRRSVYRSDKCEGKPYMFYFDIFDVKCTFRGQHAEVVSVVLAKLDPQPQSGDGPGSASKI